MKKEYHHNCEICGQETKRTTTRFCSVKCRGIWARGQRFGGGSRSKTGLERRRTGPKCSLCDNSTLRSGVKFCSKECWAKSRIIHKSKRCLICNKEFKPTNSKSKYCSLDCLKLSQKGKPKSKEHKEKLSKSAILRDMSGKNNPNYGKKAAHGKGFWYKKNNGTDVFARSSWELGIFKKLDKDNIEYLVEPKAFNISYIYNKIVKDGTYRPDIYLINEDKYLEIKGWWRDDAKEKYEAFRLQYPEISIELLFQEDLEKLGIVNKHGRYIYD